MEAELFGHTKGAFTGATGEREGLFAAADGGMLLLDELATTSAAFQASLLRVLQSGEIRRVGEATTQRVNVRVLGASNAPLAQLIKTGGFRADPTALKAATNRQRTEQGDGRGRFWTGGKSFPSGHASTNFAIATVIAHEYLASPSFAGALTS